MSIRYDKLFKLMTVKSITNSQLQRQAGFSANIITRLKRNQWNRFTNWLTKTDYGAQATTVRNIAASVRRALTTTVDEFFANIDQ